MGYFIRVTLKTVLLLILGISIIPLGILNPVSVCLFNRPLSSLIFTESEISEIFISNVKELNDEEYELWLNKSLLVAIKLVLAFYITIALIVTLIL